VVVTIIILLMELYNLIFIMKPILKICGIVTYSSQVTGVNDIIIKQQCEIQIQITIIIP